MNTGQKIATSIGLILGGFAGMAGQENPASKFLNAQLDRSIKGQELELGKKQNLLSANLQKFKNIRDAADFTRVNLNDMTARMIQEAAAKSADPLAHGRAMQEVGKLQQQSGMLMARLNAIQVAQDPRATDQDVGNAVNTLDMVEPDRAKDIRSRWIPGVGVARNPVPDHVRGTIVAMQTLNDRAHDLMHDAEQYRVSLDPRIRAQMDVKSHEILSFLNNSIQGGIITEGKMPYLESQIGNPNGLIDNIVRDNTKLKETINGNQRRYDILLNSVGLHPKGRTMPGANQQTQSTGFVPKSFQPIK
jgi:hypothetical protein